MITDMTFLMLLALAALFLIAWTLWSLHDDAHWHHRPPASHLQDRRFVSPTQQL